MNQPLDLQYLPSGARSRWVILLIFSLLVTVPGLTTMPPLDRDETRFAQASAQMLETGDLITIRFQDQERNKKPAGIYWMQAASVNTFSAVHTREIWAYRLPSVIGGILAIFFTWGIGRILFDEDTAFVGALLLGAAPALMGEATIAKTDAMLLATICAMQFAFAKIYTTTLARAEDTGTGLWPYAILLWLALGAAILIKGPIAPMIFITTIAGLVFQPGITARRALVWRWIRRLRPLTGLVLLIACILPWAIAIGLATEGRFFTEALGRDMLGKVASVQEHHSGPPGYHLALLPIVLWPGAALLFAGALNTMRQRHYPSVWFLIAWIVPAWLVFELTATKLPHYILPLLPAIALLCARALTHYIHTRSALPKTVWRLGGLLFAAIGIGVAIAVPVLGHLYALEGPGAAGFIFSALIAASAVFIASLFWRQQVWRGTLYAIALSAATCALLLTITLPSLDRLGVSPALSATLEDLGRHPLHSPSTSPAPPVTIVGYYEPSIVFLLGTDTILTPSPLRALTAITAAPSATAIIEHRHQGAFLDLARQHQLSPTALATIDGFNYSNGDTVSLTLYTLSVSLSVPSTP